MHLAVDRYVTMQHARTPSLPFLVGLMACFAANSVLAQSLSPGSSPAEEERVQLIISKPPSFAKDKQDKSRVAHERMRDAFKKHSGETTGRALSLTKAEVWSVPKSKVEALKQAAAEHGAIVTELGPDSHHVFHEPPADMTMSETQKAIMDQAKASKSTMGVKLVMGTGSRDAGACADAPCETHLAQACRQAERPHRPHDPPHEHRHQA